MKVLTLDRPMAASTPFFGHAEPEAFGDHASPAFPESLKVRYLGYSDGARAEREAWVDSLFRGAEIFAYGENNCRFLSRVGGDFDLLIVGGMDAPRMSRMMRSIVPVLGNRAKIALLNKSDARSRAQVLLGGFDEVIDPGRMSVDEAAMRIGVVWSRFARQRNADVRRNVEQAELACVADVDRLTSYERQILLRLVEKKGQDVSYPSLCESIGVSPGLYSMKNFRVLICNLRHKLKANCQILASRGRGYRLIDENF